MFNLKKNINDYDVYFNGSKYKIYGTFIKYDKVYFLLWWGGADDCGSWLHIEADRCVPINPRISNNLHYIK